MIKNTQSLVFRELGNVQTPVWGEKSCNRWWCWIAVGCEGFSAVQLYFRGASWLRTAPSVWHILFWLSPLSVVPVVLQSWLHMCPVDEWLMLHLSFGTFQALLTYHRFSVSCCHLFKCMPLWSPYRVIQEELNLPFPFFLMKQVVLRLKTKKNIEIQKKLYLNKVL